MRLINYRSKDIFLCGVVTDRGVLPLQEKGWKNALGVQNLYRKEDKGALQDYVDSILAKAEDGQFLKIEDLDIAPCVLAPSKIICVGLNYRRHAEESNMPIPETPILFNKFPNTLSGHQDVVSLPKESKQNDYEAELGIVIGKKAKYVSEEDALDYVFGYCNVNDLSSRDWQFRSHQWLLGKCCDGFNPTGPYLVTADEIPNPNQLSISCTVKGEVRQNSNTSDMIFNCSEIISYISQHMTLEPGDLILTGTPEGVMFGYPKDKQVWLEDGDVVSVEIEGLGVLTNTMKREL